MSGIQNVSVTNSVAYASVSTQSQPSFRHFANLNLSEAQRTSLRSIFANAKKTGESSADVQKQITAILTPAQQQLQASDKRAAAPAPPATASPTTVRPAIADSTSAIGATSSRPSAVAGRSARLDALLQQVLSTGEPTIS